MRSRSHGARGGDSAMVSKMVKREGTAYNEKHTSPLFAGDGVW